MKYVFRTQVTLAVVFFMASAVGIAQTTGESVYKANCASCHGASGTPSAGMAKMLNVKPVSDPDIQKLTPEQMFTSVKEGKNKMKPFKDKLTDAQIKDSITYYRSLK